MTLLKSKMDQMTTPNSHLNSELDNEKLSIVCQDLVDNIEDFFEAHDIELIRGKKMFTGKCPVHQGDNPTAFNFYHGGEESIGNWKCRTHNCQDVFKNTAIGFVRGVLSAKYGWQDRSDKDKVYSFKATMDYIMKFLKKDYGAINIDEDAIEKRVFAKFVKNINQTKKASSVLNISRQQLRSRLIYPADYYLKRGYSAEILNKYDVGLCLSPGREMSGRVVVPIYDEDYKHVVGCTGRTINPYCGVCDCYHILNQHCGKEKGRFYQKWKHNEGFTAENYLYNFWFARKYIEELGYVILVESPGNVWRLEEAGIHNSVAIFGTTLNDAQMSLLNRAGPMLIVLFMDNDAPGQLARDNITRQCGKLYNILSPAYSSTDLGEMLVGQINTEIKPILETL